jgi:type III secretory pathway lipoprotein EscJ
MKYCNNCQCEYEDFVDDCSDCGRTLVKYDDRIEDTIELEHFKLLTTCSTNNEANLLLSLLESYDIKATLQYEGSGSYLNILHGVNYQGVDVLVVPKDLDEAKEILNKFEYSYTDLPDEYESDALKKYKRNKKLIAYFIILSFIGNMLIVKFFDVFHF